RIGAPTSAAASTSRLPHQPSPTMAALSILGRGRRARLLERMRAGEGVVLHAGIDDALDGRELRQIDLEETRARRLRGEADVGDGDLVALAVAAGRLVLQMRLKRIERGAMQMLRPS